MTQAFDCTVLIVYRQFILYILHLMESVTLELQAETARQFQSAGGGPEHCSESTGLASVATTVSTTVTGSLVAVSTPGPSGRSSVSAK